MERDGNDSLGPRQRQGVPDGITGVEDDLSAGRSVSITGLHVMDYTLSDRNDECLAARAARCEGYSRRIDARSEEKHALPISWRIWSASIGAFTRDR
ncbi:hypothetical protein GCM10010358_63720 [Streptomyces minutiscleroticus]|uniref:Uncharacterized protein n=1 Tax=Streptomyces minutiscleroticus TaxID=68238 RepID=A0A918NWW6_9ACTN|nr:hypothetical protein GCM10010358_63720 [Streptomyces minutiscleroticus]